MLSGPPRQPSIHHMSDRIHFYHSSQWIIGSYKKGAYYSWNGSGRSKAGRISCMMMRRSIHSKADSSCHRGK
ncbi:hypothetical protein CUJ84_pRLN4000006 (plasmid) [Rhizobium leguminosarum]|uniref:Uncharacterized protein n=1 Tax=Rhizobium leguminosarum TaxID=384 RepID=A0A2K9ZHL4_RHILE|nr:hypothetical protein CUJ84_pRLN4000006 [Rhizobium leguminosarum]